MPTDRRTMVAAVSLVALLFGACTSGGNDEADRTDPPRRTPSVEAVADFQLVGTIDEAFSGSEPLIEIPEGGVSGSADASPTGSPDATPVGETPARPGVLRIVIDDLNEELSKSCDVSADSSVDVFWTTETRFEPGDDLKDIEDAIEGRVAGISGSIYRASGTDECVLIAEQVGLTTGSTPSTPRPVIRRTAAPTPQRTATAAPSGSPGGGKTPKTSDTPEPTSTATSSASESPD